MYAGRIIAATCNCLQMEYGSLQMEGSRLSYCHYYQLDLPNSIVNTTILSSGTCEHHGQFYSMLHTCSVVGNSLVSWGEFSISSVANCNSKFLCVESAKHTNTIQYNQINNLKLI